MMSRKSNQLRQDQEIVTVRYNRYSAWTVIKVIVFCWVVTFVMSTGAFGLVSFDVMLAKAIGIIETATEICQYCYQAIR